MRKPTICMGENKDADQLRGNREADQRLCFRYTDSTFPPLLIPKFSRFSVSSVTIQAGLCWTWSETQIVGFVMHRLSHSIITTLSNDDAILFYSSNKSNKINVLNEPVHEKTNNLGSDQVRHKPACTVTDDG